MLFTYFWMQGSRLRRPSMLYTRYFRFGREFRLSVRPSGRDFYVCFRSKFRLAVQLGSVDMHRIYIYNTKDKPYILKLNGFERFPSGVVYIHHCYARFHKRREPGEILPKWQ